MRLSVRHLPRVHLLRWWLDGDGQPCVRLDLPPGAEFSLDCASLLWKGERRGQTLELTGEGTDPRRLEGLGGALVGLPDGTRLELVLGGEGPPLRFAGPVAAGQWSIEEAPVAEDVLARALELARQAEEESFLEAGTPELAEAAATGIESEWGDACAYRVEGSRIVVDDPTENRSYLAHFAAEVFLVQPDFQAAFPGLCELLAERAEVARSLVGQLNLLLGVKTGELIYSGKKSRYLRTDLGALPWLTAEDLDRADAEFESLGYAPLGDLTADSLAGAMMRGYRRPGGTAWGSVTVAVSGEFIREFFSLCTEGSTLTTTTLPESQARPERRLYKLSLPELDLPALLAAHEAELERRELRPLPAEGELVDLAAQVDDFLQRWL